MTFCPACHASLNEQDRFCTVCGAPVAQSQIASEAPPSPAGGNAALIVGLAALAAVLVVGAVAGVLLMGGGGSSNASRSPAAAVSQPPVTQTVVEVIKSAPSTPPASAGHTSQAGAVGGPLPTRSYSTGRFRIDVPATWRQVSDEEDHSGVYRESRWNSPAGDGYLLIDYTDGFDGTPKSGADDLRGAMRGTAGYTEWAYESWLNGRFWRWEFTKDGTRKIDLFASSCGTGYALLGAASPKRFTRLRASFEAAARSLQLTC
jgi:hypothetical protein